MLGEWARRKANQAAVRLTRQLYLFSGVLLTWLMPWSGAHANDLDFSLSDESLRISYEQRFSGNDLSWHGDYLRNDDQEVDLFSAGLFVSGRSNASIGKQIAGLGVQLAQINAKGPDGGMLAFGGFIKHTLSQANLVSVRGDLFYAPDATSFDNTEKYMYFSLRLEYELLDAARVYVGYRDVEVDLGSGDTNIDDGLIGGLVMMF